MLYTLHSAVCVLYIKVRKKRKNHAKDTQIFTVIYEHKLSFMLPVLLQNTCKQLK